MSSENPNGKNLISLIATNTGLPENTLTHELGRLVECAGLDTNVVSLDELRRVLADYAQEILLSAKLAAEEECLRPASGE
jgi:hypothetical protein